MVVYIMATGKWKSASGKLVLKVKTFVFLKNSPFFYIYFPPFQLSLLKSNAFPTESL